MPQNLKLYQARQQDNLAASLEFKYDSNANPGMSFNKVNSKKENAMPGLQFATDFVFNPKKFYCRDHPRIEIEYCNSVSGNFYCKRCLPKFKGQKDRVLSEICHDVQEALTQLKIDHQIKKSTLYSKLLTKKNEVESIFQFYFDTLDTLRKEVLQ